MTTNDSSLKKITTKGFNLLLISGILFIALGVLIIFTPESSLIALGLLFATIFFVTGVFEITYAISNRNLLDNWVWNLTIGIVDLVVGILLIVNPELSTITLLLFIGLSLVFRSIMTIVWAIFLRDIHFKNWGWILALGILIFIFSSVVLLSPDFFGIIIILYLSFTLITVGFAQVLMAITLKKLASKFLD
ncbi:MAG: DUF308 domain-containing protein [Brumimicrobium sp.]